MQGQSTRTDFPRLTFYRVPVVLKLSSVVHNLWGLGFQLAAGNRDRDGYEVVLESAGRRVFYCSDVDELRFLGMCTYCILVLLPSSDVGQSVEHLMSIYRSVRERLESKFSQDQIDSCSTGGWPGWKEAVLHALVRRYRPQEVIET